MADTDPKTKRAFVIRDFTDAGTETRHVAGSTPLIEDGAFGNYEAAGLVRVPTAADVKTPAPPRVKASKKAKTVAAPPAAPASKPVDETAPVA
jgi:hypothetical protein